MKDLIHTILSNSLLFVGCVIIIVVLLMAIVFAVANRQQRRIYSKPKRNECENGHPVGEPKPFYETE